MIEMGDGGLLRCECPCLSARQARRRCVTYILVAGGKTGFSGNIESLSRYTRLFFFLKHSVHVVAWPQGARSSVTSVATMTGDTSIQTIAPSATLAD